MEGREGGREGGEGGSEGGGREGERGRGREGGRVRYTSTVQTTTNTSGASCDSLESLLTAPGGQERGPLFVHQAVQGLATQLVWCTAEKQYESHISTGNFKALVLVV